MKIPGSIRTVYEDGLAINRRLQEKVRERVLNLKDKGWHYEDRIKSQESFALKLESGRCPDPRQMEDYFGCMLVVQNGAEIKRAEELIAKEFTLVERRPEDPYFTMKGSDSFRFDDLRLYVRWRDDPQLPQTGLEGVVFEVQVKTFLFHAWAIATHDLTYKTDAVDWGKERIAFQIRAMLEHAEVSIMEAETLSAGEGLRRTNAVIRDIQEAIVMLKANWEVNDLPVDLRGLAANVSDLCKALRISLNEVSGALERENAQGRGKFTLNLSPYGAIVQSLLNQRYDVVAECLQRPRERRRIFFPPEILLPERLDRRRCRNAVFVQ